MPINQLKAGAALSYVSIALNNVIGLLYMPFMLRMMGQNEYGLYSLVSSVVAYLTVLDLGFRYVFHSLLWYWDYGFFDRSGFIF